MSATRYRSQLSGDWEQRCKGRTLVNPELAERFFLKTEYRFNPMTRSVEELLRHILLHVLPAGFVRIGHFWKPLAAVQNRLRPRSRERLKSMRPPKRSAGNSPTKGVQFVSVAEASAHSCRKQRQNSSPSFSAGVCAAKGCFRVTPRRYLTQEPLQSCQVVSPRTPMPRPPSQIGLKVLGGNRGVLIRRLASHWLKVATRRICSSADYWA